MADNDKEWFRTAFMDHLRRNQWANESNLKTKVFHAIDIFYPYKFGRTLQNGGSEAKERAGKMVDNYLKYGELPMDPWWKKTFNRLFKTPKHRSYDSALLVSDKGAFSEP